MNARLLLLAVLGACLVAMSQGQMVGGLSQGSVSDEGVKQAADFTVARLNQDTATRAHQLGASVGDLSWVHIKNVQTQVVAGTMYYLTLTVKDTHGQTFDMTARVWSQPWLESKNSAEAWQLKEVQRSDA